MLNTKEFLEAVTKERPVGTENNQEVGQLICKELEEANYQITKIPFECTRWEDGASYLKTSETTIILFASPFSVGFEGEGELVIIGSRAALKEAELKEKIVVLCEEITRQAVQPKNYPFYYPDEDKELIELLEEKGPKAILTCTGQSMLCGLNPFPVFSDGNFLIPSAYLSENHLEALQELSGEIVRVVIASNKKQAQSSQLIAVKQAKNSKGKVVICAHMDTQYHTPGALDNAAGVAVMLETAKRLEKLELNLDIEIVPFNGEEYYEASGELAYLAYLGQQESKETFVINIDSPCHKGAKTAIAYYNIAEEKQALFSEMMNTYTSVTTGESWYAGDHCMFAFQGTPCFTVSTSDLFEGGLAYTHTEKDVLETIDMNLIDEAAAYLVEVIQKESSR